MPLVIQVVLDRFLDDYFEYRSISHGWSQELGDKAYSFWTRQESAGQIRQNVKQNIRDLINDLGKKEQQTSKNILDILDRLGKEAHQIQNAQPKKPALCTEALHAMRNYLIRKILTKEVFVFTTGEKNEEEEKRVSSLFTKQITERIAKVVQKKNELGGAYQSETNDKLIGVLQAQLDGYRTDVVYLGGEKQNYILEESHVIKNIFPAHQYVYLTDKETSKDPHIKRNIYPCILCENFDVFFLVKLSSYLKNSTVARTRILYTWLESEKHKTPTPLITAYESYVVDNYRKQHEENLPKSIIPVSEVRKREKGSVEVLDDESEVVSSALVVVRR